MRDRAGKLLYKDYIVGGRCCTREEQKGGAEERLVKEVVVKGRNSQEG